MLSSQHHPDSLPHSLTLSHTHTYTHTHSLIHTHSLTHSPHSLPLSLTSWMSSLQYFCRLASRRKSVALRAIMASNSSLLGGRERGRGREREEKKGQHKKKKEVNQSQTGMHRKMHSISHSSQPLCTRGNPVMQGELDASATPLGREN